MKNMTDENGVPMRRCPQKIGCGKLLPTSRFYTGTGSDGRPYTRTLCKTCYLKRMADRKAEKAKGIDASIKMAIANLREAEERQASEHQKNRKRSEEHRQATAWMEAHPFYLLTPPAIDRSYAKIGRIRNAD